MRLRVLFALFVMVCLARELTATICLYPPPCARIRANSILFVGWVVDAGVPEGARPGGLRDVRIEVNEVFAGLSADVREVVVRTESPWLERGHSYLIDAFRSHGNLLGVEECGTSGETTVDYVERMLDFLRRRARGETETTVAVRVTDQYQPLADVNVTLSGPDGDLREQTDADGRATFRGIQPAKYHVSTTREHYRPDPDSYSDEEVEALPGTCPSAFVELQADGEVSGLVRDAKGEPVSSLKLDLVAVPADPAETGSLNYPFSVTETDSDGSFRFEFVSPGRYYLGSNIVGLNDTPVPPSYYPAQRGEAGAVPIEVTLGGAVENLLFTLPDFGPSREIRVCVVNGNGDRVPSAQINASPFASKRGEDFAELGKDLKTDETGCVTADGYARAMYAVSASFRPPGARLLESQYSQTVVIAPGEEPALTVLRLGESGRLPMPTR